MSLKTQRINGLANALLGHVREAALVAGDSAHLDFIVIVADMKAGAIGGATSLEPKLYASVLAALHSRVREREHD
jgi:hypothetical protein